MKASTIFTALAILTFACGTVGALLLFSQPLATLGVFFGAAICAGIFYALAETLDALEHRSKRIKREAASSDEFEFPET